MNRIILIGNGFDRSLGLRTSYSHFLDWIFNNVLQNLLTVKPDSVQGWVRYIYEDDLFTITANKSVILKIKELGQSTQTYIKWNQVLSSINNTGADLSIAFRDNFIKNLYDNYQKENWVDIEQLYFDLLLQTKETEITEFNESFNLIKKYLVKYLKSIEIENEKLQNAYNSYRRHFFAPRLEYNANYTAWEETSTTPHSVYFVNFNYTQALARLLKQNSKHFKGIKVQNHIHGNLAIADQIIFGYGNESSNEFYTLERKRGNQFLENIKSNNYFETTNYKDLLINLSDEFEVYIYGLSCGLSDHILLKTIMEHPNCIQIRIFYKKDDNGKNNHKEILINLSRAFSDKAMMRDKIISRMPNDNIPQF